MSSIRHAQHPTSPPQSRKAAVKAARPALLGASKSFSKSNGKGKQGKAKPKEQEEEAIDNDDGDEDDMAISFLQFWYGIDWIETKLGGLTGGSVTCDQQILVPNNSLLYCSERCKRMDAQHVSDYSSYVSTNSPTSSDIDGSDPLGSKKPLLVPRAIPTPRPTPSARIPPEAHEGKSDLDPTEWKPKLTHRPISDASKYLSQFHRTPPAYGSPRRGSPHRPAAIHAQTMDPIVPTNAPSLSATPSASSTSSSDSVVGTPYDFVNPSSMHSRANPVHLKSINLVTPRKIATPYSVPVKPTTDGGPKFATHVKDMATTAVSEKLVLGSDLSYEKWNLTAGCHSAGTGSLTTLLSGFGPSRKVTM
ncbi:MAG: hypothetical protein L6R40_002239 [Gallowayella cf. fulva]|nr:MAG: hypothetical protein L6R40_002239 [Xanthomendoza cf. fulva]